MTPEQVAGGETVEVQSRGDWAVVIRRNSGALWYVLLRREDGEWDVEDSGEMCAQDGPRATWIDLEARENLGVEIAWGGAPAGVTGGHLFIGADAFPVEVVDGMFWLVRWDVPDPAEAEEDHMEFMHD